MTIDHRSAARDHLNLAKNANSLSKDREIATAQVHATLALAEQARIANLIAVGTARIEAYDYLITSPQEASTVKAAIREGLGI